MIYLLLGVVLILVIMFYMALFKAASREDEYLAKYECEFSDEE